VAVRVAAASLRTRPRAAPGEPWRRSGAQGRASRAPVPAEGRERCPAKARRSAVRMRLRWQATRASTRGGRAKPPPDRGRCENARARWTRCGAHALRRPAQAAGKSHPASPSTKPRTLQSGSSVSAPGVRSTHYTVHLVRTLLGSAERRARLSPRGELRGQRGKERPSALGQRLLASTSPAPRGRLRASRTRQPASR